MIYDLVRYQLDKFSTLPREHILLVSVGCSWGKCTFCDYQDDKSSSVLACDSTNKKIIDQVRGSEVGLSTLDVTCSASYTELPFTTLYRIRETCIKKGIRTVILEGHYIYRNSNPYFVDFFGSEGINVLFRCGVETFDENLREDILKKGLPGASPDEIAEYYQWINLMYGMEGQTFDQLQKDIEIGLEHFERINLSIYTTVKNGPARDEKAINEFYESGFYEELKGNSRIDIFDEWDEANDHHVGHDI